jgi:hypothetical protein
MAKRTYTLVDENDETVGFVVIEQPNTFEQALPAPAYGDGPLADVALFVVVLGGFTTAAWFISGPDWLAPTVGIVLTAGLAGIKAWRSGAIGLETPLPKPEKVVIEIETWDGKQRLLLDEIEDQTIDLEDWQKVGQAVTSGANFSRPALAKVISQTTYHKVKDELVRLNMAHKNGNSYVLSPRGAAFLRKVANLSL